MTWTISIFMSVICLTSHILLVRFLGDKFPSSFITPAFYTFAVVMLYLMYFYARPKIDWSEITALNVMVPLVLAGITIGLTDFFFIKSLNLGAQASTAMPILIGGSTILVAILAFILFKEAVSLPKLIGIVMAVIGVFLIHRG